MKVSRAALAGLSLVFLTSPSVFATEYVTDALRAGEDLSGFSYRVLGTHKRWREIYQLNAGSIADLKKLVPGTLLKVRAIPEKKPAQAQIDRLALPAAHPRVPEVHSAIDPEEPMVEAIKVIAPHPALAPIPLSTPHLMVRLPSSLTGTRAQIEALKQSYDDIQAVPGEKATSLSPFKDLEIP